jgi:hypothetical protein
MPGSPAKKKQRHHGAAWREAGHAIAALRLGIQVKRMTLDGPKGRNVWNDPLRNVDFAWIKANRSAMVERLASVLVAGAAAQCALGGGEPDPTSAERLRDAQTLLDAHDHGGATLDDLQRTWAEFFSRDDANAAASALAARLMEKGEFGGKAAMRLIESHLETD